LSTAGPPQGAKAPSGGSAAGSPASVGAHIIWPAEAIWEAVAPILPGFTVEVLPQVDSTNSELMRRSRLGQTDPVLLVAERQSAGRGRLGRQWQSQAGESLTFSLGLLLAPADWAGLSLAVGVCLAEALHPQVRLKWPNDLWLDDRKLGGILIETASSAAGEPGPAVRYAVVGVGLNLAPRPADGLSTPPAALHCLPAPTPGAACWPSPSRWCARCRPSKPSASLHSRPASTRAMRCASAPSPSATARPAPPTGPAKPVPCWCILRTACTPSPVPK
jgi:hypothetical protein